ncbi:hypothetical protein HanPSC8_Chr10g0428841 [Helianthus annuus]|nr:hypothetical protein HanPSC8_Chr10g0428841 [Helianthus annuus]
MCPNPHGLTRVYKELKHLICETSHSFYHILSTLTNFERRSSMILHQTSIINLLIRNICSFTAMDSGSKAFEFLGL